MSDKPVGWGVLGATARIAQESVLPAIKKCPFANLVALASRDRASAQEIAARYGASVQAYGDYDSLIADPSVEVVYIPLPNSLHAEWAIEAMNNGKHVLCEHPLALNAEQAQEMALTATENQVILSEGFMYRYHPLQIEVLGKVADGLIGKVEQVKARYDYALLGAEDSRPISAFGGGALLDLGGYCVHIARSLIGEEPIAVTGNWKMDDVTGTDFSASASLSFPRGAEALIDCEFSRSFAATYEVIGERGKISVPDFCPSTSEEANYKVNLMGEPAQRFLVPAFDKYEAEVGAISQRVRGKNVFLLSPEDGYRNMLTLDAIARSARSQCTKIFI